MKCPSCNNEVMPFIRFYIWSNPFSTKCKSCGTKLRLDPKSRKILYFEMIVAVLLALMIRTLVGFTTAKGLVVFLLTSAVVFYPFEKHIWDNGYYEIKP